MLKCSPGHFAFPIVSGSLLKPGPVLGLCVDIPFCSVCHLFFAQGVLVLADNSISIACLLPYITLEY